MVTGKATQTATAKATTITTATATTAVRTTVKIDAPLQLRLYGHLTRFRVHVELVILPTMVESSADKLSAEPEFLNF